MLRSGSLIREVDLPGRFGGCRHVSRRHRRPGADRLESHQRSSVCGTSLYTTADSFEKVDEYYKKIGGQEVPHSRNVVPSMQFVVFRFPGKKFQVGLSRPASDQRHITIVQIYLLKAQ